MVVSHLVVAVSPELHKRAVPLLRVKFPDHLRKAWEYFETVAHAKGEGVAFSILSQSDDITSFRRACARAITSSTLEYQPIIEPANGTASGFEAKVISTIASKFAVGEHMEAQVMVREIAEKCGEDVALIALLEATTIRELHLMRMNAKSGRDPVLTDLEKELIHNEAAMHALAKKDATAHLIIQLLFGIGRTKTDLDGAAKVIMEEETHRQRIPSPEDIVAAKGRGIHLLRDIAVQLKHPMDYRSDVSIEEFELTVKGLLREHRADIAEQEEALDLLMKIAKVAGQKRAFRALKSIKNISRLRSSAKIILASNRGLAERDTQLAEMTVPEFEAFVRTILSTERKDIGDVEKAVALALNIADAKNRRIAVDALKTVKNIQGLVSTESKYCAAQRVAARVVYHTSILAMSDAEFNAHIREKAAGKFAAEELDEVCRLLTDITAFSDRIKAIDSLDDAGSVHSLNHIYLLLKRKETDAIANFARVVEDTSASVYSPGEELMRRLRIGVNTSAVVAFIADKQQYNSEDDKIAAKRLMLSTMEIYELNPDALASIVDAVTHARDITDLEFLLRTFATTNDVKELVAERKPERNYSKVNRIMATDEPLSESISVNSGDRSVTPSKRSSAPTKDEIADLEVEEAEEQETITKFLAIAQSALEFDPELKPEEIADSLAKLVLIRPLILSELEENNEGAFEVLNLRFGLDGEGIRDHAKVAALLNSEFEPEPRLTAVNVYMLEKRGLRILSRMLKE